MKRMFTALALASGLALFAPVAMADCGSCGGGDHAHDADHEHKKDEKCAGCDKPKSECACEKKDTCTGCNKPKGECACDKH